MIFAVDERCDMELDETDPTIWLRLEAATQDYIQSNSKSFKSLCDKLLENSHEDKLIESQKFQQYIKAKGSNPCNYFLSFFSLYKWLILFCEFFMDFINFRCLPVLDENSPSLGWRRTVLLVEASNSPDSGRFFYHARSLEKFCSENGIRLSMTNGISETNKAGPGLLTPFTSPMFTGSFPSSPLLYSPDLGPLRAARIDLVPPLSLDGSQPGKTIASPPDSPAKCRQLSLPILSLHDKLKSSPQVGIVHLALQNDNCGSILRFI